VLTSSFNEFNPARDRWAVVRLGHVWRRNKEKQFVPAITHFEGLISHGEDLIEMLGRQREQSAGRYPKSSIILSSDEGLLEEKEESKSKTKPAITDIPGFLEFIEALVSDHISITGAGPSVRSLLPQIISWLEESGLDREYQEGSIYRAILKARKEGRIEGL
jgi:hypothetical protein